ncbi:MAG: SRPBCC family protein [Cyanobacteria bacterium P01_D01_bin.1]
MTNNALHPSNELHAEELHTDGQLAADLPAVTGNTAISHPSTSAVVNISTEKRPARERRILASVIIPQPVENVWQVITDYEKLSDFIPSLTSSKLIPNSEGRTRLEQVGTQCFLRVKFCARVVLDMTENFPHEVGFLMKEGDFKRFEGFWKLEPADQGTKLSYDLLVKAPAAMPTPLIERHLRNNLISNLLAIHKRTLDVAALG